MDLNAVAIFAQVVESGSFTLAADNLNLTKSTVSRKVLELEHQLGVKLLVRSTRHLATTAEGQTFYQSCVEMLSIMESAEQAITETQTSIRGHINIAMPIELGHQMLMPYIDAFLLRYPDVTINLELTNREIDLISDGIDLHCQIGDPKPSTNVARRFYSSKQQIVASPSYLVAHPDILHPHDLRTHHKQVKLLRPQLEPIWLLTNNTQPNNQTSEVAVELPYQLSVNTITSALTATLDGLGICILPEFLCRPLIESGQLIQILPDWSSPMVGISFVYPERKLMPKRLRALLDFLLEELSQRDANRPRFLNR